MKKQHCHNQENSGFLKWVERVGNALPHPTVLFVILSIIVIIASGIVAAAGTSVTYFDARKGTEVTVKAISLLNTNGLRYIFNSAADNFVGFAPMRTVLIIMLGVGLAEWSGLIETSLKRLLIGVHPRLLTAATVFVGIMSNIASDTGYVVIVPLAAAVFASTGRHPIAGLAAALAGVSGGYSANLIIASTDASLASVTNEALKSSGFNYQILPTANWFIMIASTILLTILGTIVTEKIVEKNLGTYTGDYVPDRDEITPLENKALKNAGISLLILLILFAFLAFPENAPLKTLDETTGKMVLDEFLSKGLRAFLLLLFLVPGIVYGVTTGKIKNSVDFAVGVENGMKNSTGFLTLAFFAAQFISYFSHTNLGVIISVKGAELLKSMKFTGLPLVIAFIIVTAFINLFIGSLGAKWAIMAPIFVPMMMRLGIAPELTQVAYRIGDATTNIITPLMTYFPMMVAFAQKYDEDSGIGTIISTMLPYSITFLIGWTLLMVLWYLLGLPLGPNAPVKI